jgi:hypothetical protein
LWCGLSGGASGWEGDGRNAYLLDDGIVGCGGVVFDTVHELEQTLGLGSDAIICLVVREQATI